MNPATPRPGHVCCTVLWILRLPSPLSGLSASSWLCLLRSTAAPRSVTPMSLAVLWPPRPLQTSSCHTFYAHHAHLTCPLLPLAGFPSQLAHEHMYTVICWSSFQSNLPQICINKIDFPSRWIHCCYVARKSKEETDLGRVSETFSMH